MLSKYLVISLQLYVFISCVEDDVTCFPELLCNTTFSDPASLKTRSDNIVHIGVGLRIIDKNNVRQNANRSEFNEGFKVRHLHYGLDNNTICSFCTHFLSDRKTVISFRTQ